MKKNKCPHCNKLLFLGDAKEIEIKCPKCKKITIFKK
jgi:phage FluMu protein Com